MPRITVRVDNARKFATEIDGLIAEIEARMPRRGAAAGRGRRRSGEDREFARQREAFFERASQARRLAERLTGGDTAWGHVDGDAYRVREALRLSREYFGSLS